jgi:hypothetical protein
VAHRVRSRWAGRLLLLLMLVLALVSTASAEWKEKVLYSFQGGTDGATPVGGVVFDQQDNLYGTTQDGGSSSCHSIVQCGTVYQLAPPAKQGDPWTETVLYVFKGNASNDGASPYGGLVIDSAGNLYGTTGYGGTGNCTVLGTLMGCGTVFEISQPKQKGGKWTETVIYSFPTAKQGFVPAGDLVFDSAGNLYGATIFGGGFGTTCDPFYQYCGAVFRLSPPKTKGGKWTEKVLHGFKGGTDGANPYGDLVFDNTGAIYGTTSIGGNQGCNFGHGQIGCGVVFKLSPPLRKGEAWTEKVIVRFTGGSDGATPDAGLTQGEDGSFYGPTGGGGKYDGGLIFRLSRTKSGGWIESVLYDFVGNQAGQNPGSLSVASDGSVYGAAAGGQDFRGLIFRLNRQAGGKSWRFTDLYDFMGSGDGAGPDAGLIFDAVGNLYSATSVGGDGTGCTNGCGTVFQVSP